METVWKRIKADLKEYRIALLVLGIYYVLVRRIFRAFCPMVILTGLPCPGCGLSRAVWYLLTGQIRRSFLLHPLGVFWILFILYFFVNRYFLGKKVTKAMLIYLCILLLATLFLYFFRMVTIFPDRPPMSYTGRNLFEKIIPDYRRKLLSFFRLYG